MRFARRLRAQTKNLEDTKGHATRSTIARKQIANFRHVGKWFFGSRPSTLALVGDI